MGQAQAVNANKANESQFEVSERADDNLNEPPPVGVKKVLQGGQTEACADREADRGEPPEGEEPA